MAQDPFADEVVEFRQGVGGGFNADKLPGIVLGPPVGAGLTEGSTDVVSLGNGGEITLGFTGTVICDGPGPDFIVFENAFHAGGPTGPVFIEAGIVAVSQDGVTFREFPYDPRTFSGLAGKTPVLSNPENGIDPTDPTVAGGDAFDLAQLGLKWAAYVRITDGGDAISDPGNLLPGGATAGFDLDAIAAVHACEPTATDPTPTATITVGTDSTPTPTASFTASPLLPTPTATPSPTQTPRLGDLDGDGTVDENDIRHCIAELYDGDGDSAAAVAGGTVASPPSVDVNADGRVTAADVTAIIDHVSP